MADTSAVISIGTNSTRMLMVDFSAKRFGLFGDHATRIVKQRSTGTRIGEGLKESGRLDDAAMRRTLEVVQSYVNELRGKTAHLSVIATSALRRAENTGGFIQQIHDITGCDLNILEGKEEAAASFLGALTSLDDVEGQRVGVIDAGGGSTEYAVGEHEADHSLSCEIGAVRLTEWFPALAGHDGMVDNDTIDDARAKARDLLDPITSIASVSALAIVGGSATTSLSVVRGHHARFGDQVLRRDKLRDAFNMLCELPCEKRKTVPGMNPQRADILPAGMLILDTAMVLLGFEEATVSYTDLLYGYLLRERQGAAYHS